MDFKQIIEQLTITEKCQLLVGVDFWNTAKYDHLKIPKLTMADGPHGLRKAITGEGSAISRVHQAVCFPPAVTLAASFDPNLAKKMGEAIGEECRQHDVHVLLGPGINIKRNPLCGRNFEYYSEDPFLTSEMAKGFIAGLDNKKVGACIKHFALNQQESYRMQQSSIVDERCKQEIYFKAFRDTLQADPDMVMCSYNQVDDIYASENKELLDDTLRKAFGFQKVIVSDWGAVTDRTKALFASLDLEMPANQESVKLLLSDYKKGLIPLTVIDQAVARILELAFRRSSNKPLNPSLESHHQLATAIHKEAMVLLKNDDMVLPLKKESSVALIGSLAKHLRYQGGGSSHINAYKVESLLETFPVGVDFDYQPGYLLSKDGYDKSLIEQAVEIAKHKDVVVIVVGLTDEYESEGYDRTHLDLPSGQSLLIEEVARVNPNLVVVTLTGSPIVMPWLKNVRAVLNAYLGGEGAAQAITDIIFGKANPSGRLAETFPLDIMDVPSTKRFASGNNRVYYQESIYVGYRYFTTAEKPVLFPFGYGLSYTEFTYSDLEIESASLKVPFCVKGSLNVKNSGSMKGKEVVQIYVKNPQDRIFRPLRELRQFQKIELAVGASKTVAFSLSESDFSHYDVKKGRFVVNSGAYEIQICSDASTVVLSKEIKVDSANEGSPQDIGLNLKSYTKQGGFQMTDSDYESLINSKLDHEHVNKRRPYSLNDSIQDIQKTIIGRLMKKLVIKEAKKQLKDVSITEWKLYEEMVLSVPLRNLVIFSEGKVPMHLMAAVVALCNLRLLKAIKILIKRSSL